ncbi:MAG: MotA/TolQ/ExbB proton channel family protein [Puniceicoccales bacterium]|jgi:biopolymer transport protein ExbB|nr:MotA/TolQ/ExbB proton channel family protein [Puniceicoccales bacterium]
MTFYANAAVEFFIEGGPIMWPLLLCFLASLVVIGERALWWWWLARRTDGKALESVFTAVASGDFKTAARTTASAPGDPFLRVVHKGLTHAHVSFLGAMQLEASKVLHQAEKRLWLLAAFITLAPFLGLLGTVTGIRISFEALGVGELAATRVTGGIAEALIATICGLVIAILCLLPYSFFNRCLSDFRSRLEQTINHLELLCESARQRGFDVAEAARQEQPRG